jgi:hypothetical protein
MNFRFRFPATLIGTVAAITLFYCLIIFNAFPGDSLMYHLPFAARFWRLPGLPNFSGYFEGRYQGFPILWRVFMLPGLLLKAPRLLFLPNLLGMFLLCWSARTYLLLSWPLCVIACLCYPVVLFGFASSMQDFFVGATAVAGAIALFAASLLQSSDSKRAWLAGLLLLALSANVKYQGLILSAIILSLSLGYALILRLSDSSKCHQLCHFGRDNFLGVFPAMIVLLISLQFIQPIVNLYRFHNPLYPNNVFVFKGPEATGVSTLPYIPKIPLVYNGLSFFSSVLEIDPILRSSRRFLFERTVHMQNPPDSISQPVDMLGNRWVITGGSYGILYILLLFTATLSSIRTYGQRAKNAVNDSTQETYIKRLHLRLMISILVTILLPQTLELRYYMYNLLVPALVAVSSPWRDLRHFARWLAVFTVLGTLITSIIFPLYFWARTNIWLHSRISWDPMFAAPSTQQCMMTNHRIVARADSLNLESGSIRDHSILCYFRLR